MSRRAHISDRTRLAAALRELGAIPYEHAKLIHEDQIISLFEFDHGILHGVEPIDDHWNLTPRFRVQVREKNRRDTSTVAKVKRLERAIVEAQARLLAKATGDPPPEPRRRKAKIKSRGFPKQHRPIRSRGFERRSP